jgi:hypothetical protein
VKKTFGKYALEVFMLLENYIVAICYFVLVSSDTSGLISTCTEIKMFSQKQNRNFMTTRYIHNKIFISARSNIVDLKNS